MTAPQIDQSPGYGSELNMTAAAKLSDNTLTLDEMKAKFDGEWVLVEDPELDDALEVLSGRVWWHSPDRDEVYRKAVELRLGRSAFLSFRRRPPNTYVML